MELTFLLYRGGGGGVDNVSFDYQDSTVCTDVKKTHLNEEKVPVNILWKVDPFLSNDSEIISYKTAAAR